VSRGGRWLAAGLVVLGVVLLVDRTVPALDLRELAGRWWPLALIALGVIGVLRLLPTANTMVGPVLLIAAGGVALVLTLNPFPSWARPLVLPVSLLAVGLGLLLPGRPDKPRTSGGGTTQREMTVLGGPVTWDPAEHPLLQLKTVIGGCELTILPPPARTDDDPAPRLEIVALLAGVDVVVPRGIKVHVDSRGFGGREQVLADESRRPADTDLTIVVLSAFASLRVKTPV
jgi:hypothetical protein